MLLLVSVSWGGRLQPSAVACTSYLLIRGRRFAPVPAIRTAFLLPITLDHSRYAALLAVKEPL